MTEQNKQIEQKATFFKSKNVSVYIKLNSGFFYRGTLLDVSSDFLILKDQKLGEMPIFYSEINIIEPQDVRG